MGCKLILIALQQQVSSHTLPMRISLYFAFSTSANFFDKVLVNRFFYNVAGAKPWADQGTEYGSKTFLKTHVFHQAQCLSTVNACENMRAGKRMLDVRKTCSD